MQFGNAFYPTTFDPSEGLVSGANVADSASLPKSAEAKRLSSRYEQLNPDWREGKTLPILFSVDARLIRHNLTRILRRSLRR